MAHEVKVKRTLELGVLALALCVAQNIYQNICSGIQGAKASISPLLLLMKLLPLIISTEMGQGELA
jgi:hypothetical protein